MSTEPKSENPLPTCQCGHNKNHPMVQAKGEYTTLGHFLVIFGVTYKPLKVRYFCLKCNKYFDETTDENILKYFS
ncbi:MAG: hypothetical protein V4591_00155 [Bdellovibrionota bacterium]